MKVKELIELLQKENPEAMVECMTRVYPEDLAHLNLAYVITTPQNIEHNEEVVTIMS